MPELFSGEDLTLSTAVGEVRCRLHRACGDGGIVWVFGAGGGLGGPAGGVYERLAAALQPQGVTSLQVAYRMPGRLRECVEDTLAGAVYVRSLGAKHLVLVGHSFGGAVVINAGAVDEAVIAVAALSSQAYGATGIRRLGSKLLLLMHGEADEVLPVECSRDLYEAATGPKELRLYHGCRHGLDQCRDELDRDLTEWLRRVLGVR